MTGMMCSVGECSSAAPVVLTLHKLQRWSHDLHANNEQRGNPIDGGQTLLVCKLLSKEDVRGFP